MRQGTPDRTQHMSTRLRQTEIDSRPRRDCKPVTRPSMCKYVDLAALLKPRLHLFDMLRSFFFSVVAQQIHNESNRWTLDLIASTNLCLTLLPLLYVRFFLILCFSGRHVVNTTWQISYTINYVPNKSIIFHACLERIYVFLIIFHRQIWSQILQQLENILWSTKQWFLVRYSVQSPRNCRTLFNCQPVIVSLCRGKKKLLVLSLIIRRQV